MRNCVFRDLDNPGASGGILANSSVAGLDLDAIDCVFENCTSTSGGAIRHDDGVLLISGCEFRNCSQRAVQVSGHTGGVVERATITGCTFIGNTSTGGGGALQLSNVTGGAVVTDCWFEGNVDGGAGGGAISVESGTPATIERSVFLFNATPAGQGGAIRVKNVASLVANIFYGGSAGTSGSAVAFVSGSNGSQLLNNIIAASTTTEAVFVFNSTVTTGCNIFWQNAAGIGDGYTPGPTDRVVDPAFCDSASKDFTVAQDSPALPAYSNGCGQIGAFGQGCGPVSVETRSWGSIKSEYR
jgi:predicted outer membrane repeat protein